MLNWFRKLGIRNKLLLTYAVIVLISTIALVLNIRGTNELGAAVEESAHEVESEAALVAELREFQELTARAKLAKKDYLLTGDPAYLDIHEEAEEEADERFDGAMALASEHQRADLLDLRELVEAEARLIS